MDSTYPLTEQLRSYAGGNRGTVDALVREILPKMKRIAASKLRRERDGHPMTPTELVGEVWASNLHRCHWEIKDRNHFFSIVGLTMQNALTDLARRRLAERRGKGAPHISLDSISIREQPSVANAEQVIEIGILLEKLAIEDKRVAAIVQWHYVAGFSLEEIASETGLTLRQVRHLWHKGKKWLAARMVSRKSAPKPRPEDPGQSVPQTA